MMPLTGCSYTFSDHPKKQPGSKFPPRQTNRNSREQRLCHDRLKRCMNILRCCVPWSGLMFKPTVWQSESFRIVFRMHVAA